MRPESKKVPLERVRHFLSVGVKEFTDNCRQLGKDRGETLVAPKKLDLGQAVECAIVEMLGDTPNLKALAGSAPPYDGTVLIGPHCWKRYDVKCSIVENPLAWDKFLIGWNNYPKSRDGRVHPDADLVVGSLVTQDLTRCEVFGYNFRDAVMRESAKHKAPVYHVDDMLPITDLMPDPGATYQKCDECWKPVLLLAQIEVVVRGQGTTEYRQRHVCADCWRALGSPWPRGGSDRHRVLAGKT